MIVHIIIFWITLPYSFKFYVLSCVTAHIMRNMGNMGNAKCKPRTQTFRKRIVEVNHYNTIVAQIVYTVSLRVRLTHESRHVMFVVRGESNESTMKDTYLLRSVFIANPD